jgi:hypothetical protein
MPRDLTTRTKGTTDDVEATGGGLEEFAPRARPASDSPVSSGWSVDKPVTVVKGDRPRQFKVPEDGEEILLKFLEDQPFAAFYQHWVKVDKGMRRAYTCLGKNCPLCAVGDRPKPQDWFNVIEMRDEPVLGIWYCSADPSKAIKTRADNKRTSPINKDGLYWAASKKKASNGFNEYSIDPVKEEELQPDWGVAPLTADKLKEFSTNAYDSTRVPQSTKAELQEVVDEYFQD